ncbi:hypothetical protein NZK32_07530 [Cyanobium sp. FGCU-52]|nr:hypothetical protein [Cyanobium sp. FGCU52]
MIEASARTEAGENFSGQWFLDFVVSWDGFPDSSRWVIQMEWEAPSRLRTHPAMRRRRSRSRRFSDLQGHAHSIRRQATGDISLTILEEKLNGGLQIRSCFFHGFSLAVRAGNLEADRPEATFRSWLDQGSQFSLHQTRLCYTFQSF